MAEEKVWLDKWNAEKKDFKGEERDELYKAYNGEIKKIRDAFEENRREKLLAGFEGSESWKKRTT